MTAQLTKYWEVTYDGLASYPGRVHVAILHVTSYYMYSGGCHKSIADKSNTVSDDHPTYLLDCLEQGCK